MPLSSSDFLHLPATILGDSYTSYIETWISEAATLEPDDEAIQKNIVSYRYWEAAVNLVMAEPAVRELGYETIEYTPEQIRFYQTQLAAAKRLVTDYYPSIAASSYFEAVY